MRAYGCPCLYVSVFSSCAVYGFQLFDQFPLQLDIYYELINKVKRIFWIDIFLQQEKNPDCLL